MFSEQCLPKDTVHVSRSVANLLATCKVQCADDTSRFSVDQSLPTCLSSAGLS